MKTSRTKKVRKTLGFYVNNYKFHQPFQVLIDGTFAFAALQNKFNIQKQLGRYFQSETKLLTTACIILETEKLGTFSPAVNGAMQIVKQYVLHRCGHEKKPISGSKCFLSMIGKDNSARYIIATQDRELQDKVRIIPGVPLIYLHGKVPTLDSPSEASRKHAEAMQKGLGGISTWEKENVKALRKQAGLEEKETKLKKKKKKGGPNPLSCLKKKKKPEAILKKNGIKSGKVRRRKSKIAPHIKEALLAELKNKHRT
ncbi:PREDICTED: rRNA-processing protein UTP23 homolog [Cyphomyrmex costatus]|uniref:rRNA-processing protein UTP23 homolog n=1 Tax=Cyphomyrmex costatus TaxID=456900 RepID=A0A195D409_9HYME|nr:PREDICTED: rRNA-processing protein UTP23 homolog [Cyphomyrmex costatus]KYN07622.1 rRNA-processing protein UTP23 like protein [Cyphomyrmex costatus]